MDVGGRETQLSVPMGAASNIVDLKLAIAEAYRGQVGIREAPLSWQGDPLSWQGDEPEMVVHFAGGDKAFREATTSTPFALVRKATALRAGLATSDQDDDGDDRSALLLEDHASETTDHLTAPPRRPGGSANARQAGRPNRR